MKTFAEKILADLEQKGAEVGYKKAVVVGLFGDLGSGKTAFSQNIAKLLGVEENVTSPTFVIEKIYKTNKKGKFETLVHIDAYRIEEAEEMNKLRFSEVIRQPNTLVLIEWPEKIKEVLPANQVNLNFKFIDENTREISH